jgi:hypothetical protein
MSTGDGLTQCSLCGEPYYRQRGHSCRFTDMLSERLGGMGQAWSWPWPRPGWECPRCKRVYGPSVMECHTCNKAVDSAEEQP